MLSNVNEIEQYFDTDNYKTDDIVTLKNDIYLTLYFVKMLITKYDGKIFSFAASLHNYYWREENKIISEGSSFPVSNKGAYLYFEVVFDRSYKAKVCIHNDCNGIIHFKIKGKRRSLKVDDTSETINLKWLRSMVEEDIKNSVTAEEDKRVASFQADLAVPWMTQMMIDIGISPLSIETSKGYIKLKNFDRNTYWSVVNLSVETNKPSTSFEDMSWYINIKGKLALGNISGSNIVKMIEVFKASGYFKK